MQLVRVDVVLIAQIAISVLVARRALDVRVVILACAEQRPALGRMTDDAVHLIAQPGSADPTEAEVLDDQRRTGEVEVIQRGADHSTVGVHARTLTAAYD